jgi:hypothetical protein
MQFHRCWIMKKNTRLLKPKETLASDISRMRKAVAQMLSRDGKSAVRNLDFYRQAEEQLALNHSANRGGQIHLSLWRAEW